MALVDHQIIANSELHQPRVDGLSLVLESGPVGEEEQATLNMASLVDTKVAYWSAAARKFVDTGVSLTEIKWLDTVVPGDVAATKALVVDSSRNLGSAGTPSSRVNNLRLQATLFANRLEVDSAGTGLDMSGTNIFAAGDITASGHIVGADWNSDLSVLGDQIFLNTQQVIKRTANLVQLGNLSDVTDILSDGATTLKANYGSGQKTIWHAGNDGSGSGLDADQLDGQQGVYYRDVTNMNAGTLVVSRGGSGKSTLSSGQFLVGSDASPIITRSYGTALNQVVDPQGKLIKPSNGDAEISIGKSVTHRTNTHYLTFAQVGYIVYVTGWFQPSDHISQSIWTDNCVYFKSTVIGRPMTGGGYSAYWPVQHCKSYEGSGSQWCEVYCLDGSEAGLTSSWFVFAMFATTWNTANKFPVNMSYVARELHRG